jgi:hypothetical protein
VWTRSVRRGRRARSLLRTHILEEIVLLGCWTWSAALSKLIVRECVKDAEARRKLKPKRDNQPKPSRIERERDRERRRRKIRLFISQ